MNKKQLIELIQTTKGDGIITPDVLKSAHPIIVSKYIDMYINAILYELFKKNPFDVDSYGKWYTEEVKQNGSKYYCDLPCGKVSLPNNTSSVRKVVISGSPDDTTFINVKAILSGAFNRLGTTNRGNNISYQITNLIEFDSNFDNKITSVDIFAITPFSDLSDTDEITIPMGRDVELVQTVLQLLSTNAEKQINNNG